MPTKARIWWLVYHERDREKVEKVFVGDNQDWSLERLDFSKVMRINLAKASMIVYWKMDEGEGESHQVLIEFEKIMIKDRLVKAKFCIKLK